MKYKLRAVRGSMTVHERESRRERTKLFRTLEAADVVTLTALVGPEGSGGGQSRYEAYMALQVHLCAWREADGPVRTGALRLVRPASDREVRSSMEVYTPGTVIRVQARSPSQSTGEPSHALLERLVSAKVRDRELQAEWRRLSKPVRHRDPTLGVLTLDRSLDTWDGRARWQGKPVKVSADGESSKALAASLATAHRLWRAQRTWDAKVRRGAVRHLLALANDWAAEAAADDNAPRPKPITSATFLSRLSLETICVHTDRTFSFWFNDGNLFWDHAVVVRGHIERGINDASIEG
jgi:hypothetical protein